ncbi:Bro-N domain-containing protein [Pseudomonas sp. 10B1]|uniref:BRO-N domain-containing protein n=1 Tax=unclassified Pseudomonas TaxID=196821 RepID=UPI002B23D419|nr:MULTISPECIES: Bro-N domain-containing protein [unclassified Pseudomonas]MEA9994292.1 Bro-N domain-containing protein [Pseudomonas sp. AA4]MEB0088531.1 Bro-N domain-containing protein [Pseudomonas sp. RTI1]MEB0126546.1 Bro-N domain-containing protein [Pseudomonas sp. CCC1.2]MEB0154641.1 Bro-N domain-containing protein [Pseudomonas sp. CCC4.3]MEB0221142.1 Bro-N domain-containing protein [Pseudomonas sp. AB12(2023)]
MNVSLFNFRKAQVRVVTEDDGTPWFVGKDVCDVLGYANQSDAMGRHCRGVAKRYPILDSLGRSQEARVLSEGDTLRLIINSTLPAAQEFESWVFDDLLPTLRRTGTYTVIQAPTPSANDATILIESMSRTLNLPPSATLGMYQKYAAKIGQADLLPVYAIDAPDGDDSSHTTAAIGTLITKFKLPTTSRKVYLAMQAAGLVERKQRPSKSRGVKEYWALTDTGKTYGKNATNPANQLEVQPHIYESKLDALLEVLNMPELN